MLNTAIELALAQQDRMQTAAQAGKTRAEFFAQPEEQMTSVLIKDALVLYNASQSLV